MSCAPPINKVVQDVRRQERYRAFDIRDLLANEGITEDLRRAFLVYLLSHNRPLFEVLSPRKKSLQAKYKSSFLKTVELQDRRPRHPTAVK